MDEVKNAIIKSAHIDTENGFLDIRLMLDYGSAMQSFGGYNLFSKHLSQKEPGNFAGLWLCRCMEIAGVSDWSRIVGKAIRVLGDNSHIEAIGHIIEDKWFYPKKEFLQLEEIFATKSNF
jgi:hypothetical protein